MKEKKEKKAPKEKKKEKQEKPRLVHQSVKAIRHSLTLPSEVAAGIAAIGHHGYAVFSNVVTCDQLATLNRLFWDYIEAACKDVHRDQPATWTNSR